MQPKQSRLEDFVSNAFPFPVCAPRLISPREGSKSASRWRPGCGPVRVPIPRLPPHLGDLGACQLSKSHHTRKLAPRRPCIPFAVLWSSQRPVAEQGKVERCTRPHPPFRVPSTRGGLESDGTDWIPGVALCVLADSSLRCACAGLDCGEGDRLMILPPYRGQERSGCNLYSVF